MSQFPKVKYKPTDKHFHIYHAPGRAILALNRQEAVRMTLALMKLIASTQR